jgi:hypothetical protein
MSTRSSATSTKSRVRGRSNGPRAPRKQFVLCLRSGGYEASLEPRKIYVALPDADAAAHGQLRVIDESGEDYLFPASLFVPIRVPTALRRALLAAVYPTLQSTRIR